MSEPSLVERIAEVIQVNANARHVYADPIERDGITIIPVATIQWGFGGGAIGHGVAERGGGGGGARAIPAGFIEVKNGAAEFRRYRSGADVAVLVGSAVLGLAVGLFLGRR